MQAATGGIMVARGDLGIELPIETIPVVQKRLLRLAGRYSKPSITATQMLASMVSAPRPTRAEATDVANAVFDGTDALMLSEETAVGRYPVEAVRMMARIAEQTEESCHTSNGSRTVPAHQSRDVADTVSYASSSRRASARARRPRRSDPQRPHRAAGLCPPARVHRSALSPRPETVRRVNLLWGVRAAYNEEAETLEGLLADCARRAAELGVASPGT